MNDMNWKDTDSVDTEFSNQYFVRPTLEEIEQVRQSLLKSGDWRVIRTGQTGVGGWYLVARQTR